MDMFVKVALGLGVVGLLYITYKKIGADMGDVTEVRGMRNKNPMNVVKTGINWDGKVAGNDPTFETFKSYKYGIRAGAKLLVNYERLYGINTIRGLISRYAPSHENPTNAYIQHVANSVGVDADQAISVKGNLFAIVKAIIGFEIGKTPFKDSYIENSIKELTA